ncbi:MAG: flagellar export protein FliJ [Phycisphaerales bacterium JB040]
MKAFRFRLQPVLDQRLREERSRQLVVAEIERERRALEDTLRETNRTIESERADWRDRVSGGSGHGPVDLRGARFQASASVSLVAEAQRLVLRLAGVHTRLERARERLLEATTRRRAVESLRDRHRSEWQRRIAQSEARDLDDLTVMRYARPEHAEEVSP